MKRGLLFILLVLTMAIQPASAQEIVQDSHPTWDEAVMFSHPGGFYQESFLLSLECTFPTHQIRYTLNGNTPDSSSALYTAPLMMDSTMFSKSNIYTIVDCIPSQFFLADEVERVIHIRLKRVDVPCFIDYEIFEIFSSNCDWPANNALCWQAAEGKPFRFIFYDGDGCFSKATFDAWGNATDSNYPSKSSSRSLSAPGWKNHKENYKNLIYNEKI